MRMRLGLGAGRDARADASVIAVDTSVVVAAFASWREGQPTAVAALGKGTRLTMRIVMTVTLLLALLPATTAMGQTENRIRLQGIWSSPTGDLQEEELTIEADEAFGARLAWEFLFGGRFGVELAAASSEHEVAGTIGPLSVTVGDLRVTPVTASFLYHFTPGATADFYAGGGAAHVNFGDVDLEDGSGSFSVDHDFTFTVQAGVDLFRGEAWGLSGAVQYIAADAEDETGETLGVEPVIVSLGAVVRF
jgi:outer membrane protein W